MRKKVLGLLVLCATLVIASIAPARATDTSKATGDYSGDGVSDTAVARPNNDGTFTWFVRDTVTHDVTTDTFGQASDFPVPADFDGDGRVDEAVWRTSGPTAFFYTHLSSGGFTTLNFGLSSDRPVIADFDGDGRADVAMVRKGVDNLFTWYFAFSDGSFGSYLFGQAGDWVTAGDFNGDGVADLVARRNEGGSFRWYFAFPDGSYANDLFGLTSDFMVSGDFNGDGIADMAVARQDNAANAYHWYIRSEIGGAVTTFDWGDPASDYPIVGDYNGDGQDDATAWRLGTPYNYYARDSASGSIIPMDPFGTQANGQTQPDIALGYFELILNVEALN
jgi:hypothetical protein